MKVARAKAAAKPSGPITANSARIWFLAFFLLLAGMHLAFAAPPTAAGFLADLRDQAIAQLAEPGISEDERTSRFTVLLRETLDTARIARFVTGPTWRDADEGQRKAFLQAFEASIVARFLPLLGNDASQRIVFNHVTQAAATDQRIVKVKSAVQRDDGSQTRLTWRLRKMGDSYRILDISAEGISMAMTLRDEYAAVLNANGGDLGALARLISKRTASQKG